MSRHGFELDEARVGMTTSSKKLQTLQPRARETRVAMVEPDETQMTMAELDETRAAMTVGGRAQRGSGRYGHELIEA
ncbi:hypothetical protein NL676_030668 [Syzygium grande]|nr:hypothetical protein NL676_030668 [Syzygium grande]